MISLPIPNEDCLVYLEMTFAMDDEAVLRVEGYTDDAHREFSPSAPTLSVYRRGLPLNMANFLSSDIQT